MGSDMRTRARELRAQGRTYAAIKAELGMTSNYLLAKWIQDVPGRRRHMRQWGEGREEAEAMRREGKSYREIQAALGINRSTLSGWLKDVPITEEHRAALKDNQRAAAQRRADTLRAQRIARTNKIHRRAADEIGALDDRNLLIAGAVLYWAKGAKAKPWNPHVGVDFINSDPGLVRLFLRWLDRLGVDRDRVRLKISIHETADLEAAYRHWQRVTGMSREAFLRPQIKKHKPRTNRRNIGAGYHGCLGVKVRRSTDLYRRIDGWVQAIVGPDQQHASSPSCHTEEWSGTLFPDSVGEPSQPYAVKRIA